MKRMIAALLVAAGTLTACSSTPSDQSTAQSEQVQQAEEGWIDAAIYFDGQEWKLMDSTFASSNNSSQAIMKYIGNGANYQAKYLY